jgi:hypothetical protein
VSQGAATRTVNGITKKYKGVGKRIVALTGEMKALRAEWNAKVAAKTATRN